MKPAHYEQLDTAFTAFVMAEGTPEEARMESRLTGALIDALGFHYVDQHVSRSADTASEILYDVATGRIELEDDL